MDPLKSHSQRQPGEATENQRHLLDILLDPQCGPKERAVAGDALAVIGDSRPGVGLRADGIPDIVWCEVPAGKFTMGSEAYDAEKPIRTVTLPAFKISKYPITYQQFQAFIEALDGYSNRYWWRGLYAEGLKQQRSGPGEQHFKAWNRPRDDVSWYDAMAFCRWLSANLGYEITLPTEEQWEKAARGTDGRIYPYGNRFDCTKGNTVETGICQTSAVGIFLQGASPYGVMDMSGNVFEWALAGYDNPANNDLSDYSPQALRGGSWPLNNDFARATFRSLSDPQDRSYDWGFRVCFEAVPLNKR